MAARAPAPEARRRRTVRTSEAAPPPRPAADDRGRHGGARQGSRRRARGARAAGLGGPAGVGVRARPGPPRRPGDRRGAARAGGDPGGRGGDRRPRRRLAGRPVRVLRRGALPDRGAAASAGDLLGRPSHRPDADRRRRRGLLLHPNPRRRGGRPGRLPRRALRRRSVRAAPGGTRTPRGRSQGAHACAVVEVPRPARRAPPHPPPSAGARAASQRQSGRRARDARWHPCTCWCSDGPPSGRKTYDQARRRNDLDRLALALAAHDPAAHARPRLRARRGSRRRTARVRRRRARGRGARAALPRRERAGAGEGAAPR